MSVALPGIDPGTSCTQGDRTAYAVTQGINNNINEWVDNFHPEKNQPMIEDAISNIKAFSSIKFKISQLWPFLLNRIINYWDTKSSIKIHPK